MSNDALAVLRQQIFSPRSVALIGASSDATKNTSRPQRYMRRYVQPLKNPLTGEVKELDFDVIMELWWDSAEDMAADMKDFMASPLVPAIRDSGNALFASADNPAFTVIEYETPRG